MAKRSDFTPEKPFSAEQLAEIRRNFALLSTSSLQQAYSICDRVSQLTGSVSKSVAEVLEAEIVQMLVTERLDRLAAIDQRWRALREAKACFGRDDFEGAMKTGVVLRKKRWIGGKDGYEITEYEINTALIESLNSIERRAAIETGQEVDRAGYQPAREGQRRGRGAEAGVQLPGTRCDAGADEGGRIWANR